MYGERQRDRKRSSTEILLHLRSVQNMVLNLFHSLVFPKALNTSLTTQSTRHCISVGAVLSSTVGILSTYEKQTTNCRSSREKRTRLTARSTTGQLCTQLVQGWGCIRSENKVIRVCQLEMGKLCNYSNMSMPACSERRLGTWICFYTC